MSRPKCVIVTGRPGAGKTTLTKNLAEFLYYPRISRDEVKEGYVNTFGIKHDQLPDETNGVVNQVFFRTVRHLLQGRVSIIIEAAFDHTVWDHVIPDILKIADTRILICELDAETSARRHLERGLANPRREYYHGDRRVAVYRETGCFEPGGEYNAPEYDVPTLRISTFSEYDPPIPEIADFIHQGQYREVSGGFTSLNDAAGRH